MMKIELGGSLCHAVNQVFPDYECAIYVHVDASTHNYLYAALLQRLHAILHGYGIRVEQEFPQPITVATAIPQASYDELVALRECATYVLESEEKDYLQWCEQNDINPYTAAHVPHIYRVARNALGLGPLEEIC